MPQYTARGIIPLSGGSGFPAVFQGSPNATISSINTSGGIVMAQTSSDIPFVHLSASAITCSGTTTSGNPVVPFTDLEFTWIGDSGLPVETMTSYSVGPGGVSVNANATQYGPESVFYCGSPGTYTFTLLIRGKNGAGFTTASVQGTYTYNAYTASAGDWYFDSTAAGGGNGSIGSPFNAISDLNTKMQLGNAAIHIKKGSSWSGTVGLTGTGPLRIDTYGSGATPSFTMTGGTDASFQFNGNNSDLVMFGPINFVDQVSNFATTSAAFLMDCLGVGNTCTDRYLYKISISTTVRQQINADHGDGIDSGGTLHDAQRAGYWGCTLSNSSATNYGIYSIAYKWGWTIGGSVTGTGSDDTRHQHIYPQIREHSLFRYINFGTGTGRNYCINGNYDRYTATLEYAQWMVVSDCNLTGTHRGVDASNGDENQSFSRFKNVVIQRSLWHGLDLGLWGASCCEQAVMRDHYCWNFCTDAAATTGFEMKSCAGAALNQVYRNNMYKPTGGGAPFDEGMISWSGSYSNPQVQTDNNLQDQRSTSGADLVECWNGTTAAQLSGLGSIFDRNNYYAPNSVLGFYTTDTPSTNVAFAAWKIAINGDSNGSFTNGANGAWPDAANGVFS